MQVDSSWEGVRTTLQYLWDEGLKEYIRAGQPNPKYLPQLVVDEANVACWISVLYYEDPVSKNWW